MSDLTQHAYRWCISNDYFEVNLQSKDKKRYYRVTRSAANPGEYGINWHCECRGFYYYRKCQHVRKAKNMVCGYGGGAASGSPATDIEDTCPKCFGPTSVVQVAS